MIAGFESVNSYRLKKASLSYEVVDDGVVYPCIPKEDDKVKVYGCVLDCHMKPVELSFTTHCDFAGNTSIICGDAPPPAGKFYFSFICKFLNLRYCNLSYIFSVIKSFVPFNCVFYSHFCIILWIPV